MSRGPGTLGRRILAELEAAPGGVLPWRELKKRFPLQVADKGFYASIRSLKRQRRILDHNVSGRRYTCLVPVYQKNGRPHLAFEADRSLDALCNEAHRQLAAVCKARGISPSKLPEYHPTTVVEAYVRLVPLSE
ncbi:hypothetical protein BH24ACT22_BH24ACT22_12130 [soil metagenome]